MVIPIKEKKGEEIVAAILKGLTLMGKRPDILYTDEEGALSNVWVPAVSEEAGIQHITAGTAYFVERFDRTFKNRMADRGQATRGRQDPIPMDRFDTLRA